MKQPFDASNPTPTLDALVEEIQRLKEAYDLLHDVYTYCLPPHRRWEEEAREVERKIQNFFGTAP